MIEHRDIFSQQSLCSNPQLHIYIHSALIISNQPLNNPTIGLLICNQRLLGLHVAMRLAPFRKNPYRLHDRIIRLLVLSKQNYRPHAFL